MSPMLGAACRAMPCFVLHLSLQLVGMIRHCARLYHLYQHYYFISLLTSYSVTYKDEENGIVLNRLVREVKFMNSTFLTEHIKGTRLQYSCIYLWSNNCMRLQYTLLQKQHIGFIGVRQSTSLLSGEVN